MEGRRERTKKKRKEKMKLGRVNKKVDKNGGTRA